MSLLTAILWYCLGFASCLILIMILSMFHTVSKAEEDIKEKSQKNIKQPI